MAGSALKLGIAAVVAIIVVGVVALFVFGFLSAFMPGGAVDSGTNSTVSGPGGSASSTSYSMPAGAATPDPDMQKAQDQFNETMKMQGQYAQQQPVYPQPAYGAYQQMMAEQQYGGQTMPYATAYPPEIAPMPSVIPIQPSQLPKPPFEPSIPMMSGWDSLWLMVAEDDYQLLPLLFSILLDIPYNPFSGI